MIGLIAIATLGLVVICWALEAEGRRKYYLRILGEDNVGKTSIRVSEKSGEVYTFKSEKDAIEHPQEITFDPNKSACHNRETLNLYQSKHQKEMLHMLTFDL